MVRRWRSSPGLIWAVPIIAALVGLWLAFQAIRAHGPTVTVSFREAPGIVAGKTKIKYRDVDVGEVRAIGFARDRSRVIVTAELSRDAGPWMVEDTRFWLVEPRVTLGEVSGLSTLVSGSHIALDVGASSRPRRDFEALGAAPFVTAGLAGRAFVARAGRAIRVGSPIYYRHLEVGQVTSSDLDAGAGDFSIGLFVRAPYDRNVTTAARFWEESGIRGFVDANGARVETESLVTMFLGGVSFEAAPDALDAPPAPPGHAFPLYPNREQAMKQTDGAAEDYRLVFRQSVRGLGAGAPVDLRGIPVGEVVRIGVEYDPGRVEFSTVVHIRVYPQRLQARMPRSLAVDGWPDAVDARLRRFVDHGLRAQLRMANLLTGQLFVALDFFPRAPRARYDETRQPREIPTVASDIDDLRASLTAFVRKMDRLPIDDIGRMVGDARQVLAKAGSAIDHADAAVSLFGPRSARSADIDDALRQITRAARSVRALSDGLDRHPESLVRGRK